MVSLSPDSAHTLSPSRPTGGDPAALTSALPSSFGNSAYEEKPVTSPPAHTAGSHDTTMKYRAPALEKGLDVLELLAANKKPMTLSQISHHLDRSVSELFRMVQVLENRGYVAPAQSGEGLELTNKLFSLGMSRGPNRNLLASAMPIMQGFSENTHQACHLVIPSQDNIVVIARIEAPGDLGFSIRVGYQRKMADSLSGVAMYAFQSQRVAETWRPQLKASVSPKQWQEFTTRCQQARDSGFAQGKSTFVEGIVDISCAVFDGSNVIAALSVPFIRTNDALSLDDTVTALRTAAQTLSQSMGATQPATKL